MHFVPLRPTSVRTPIRKLVLACIVSLATIASAENLRVKLQPDGGLLVDDKPFLPIFVWAQPSHTLAAEKALGFNAVHQGESEDKDPLANYLDVAHQNGLLVLADHERFKPGLKDHAALLAWTVEHEPDMPEDPPYQADVDTVPGAVWLEGEQPNDSTFKPNPWLDKAHPKLSGQKWLSAAANGQGRAVYEFQTDVGGPYTLWVREFNKAWANPTRWQIDGQPPQETSRTLKAEENTNIGGGRGVAWVKYCTVTLDAGKHTLRIEVVPGRTSGDANKPTTADAVWAVDALCFVPGDAKFPKAKPLPFTPRRAPSVAKANYERMKAADPNALCWTVLTGFFHKNYNRLPLALYDEYLKQTDIVSFDHYPVTGWNQPDKLVEVGQMTSQLAGMARKGQPVWSIIEASDQELSWTSPQTKGPTPQQMRAEAWMCIASGAKGIGYFTIGFGRGKAFKWNNLRPAIEAELKRTNAELTELAGPIVAGDSGNGLKVSSDESDDKVTNGHALMAIRKDYQGKTYLICVNVTRKTVKPTLSVEGVAGTVAQVWKEDRTIPFEAGALTDAFEPLAVHIYVVGR